MKASSHARSFALTALCLIAPQLGPIRGVRVTHPLAPGEIVLRSVLDSSGTRLHYAVYSSTSGIQLFSTSSDGSGGAVALTDPLDSTYAGQFVLSPDGRRLAYASDHEVASRFELYSVPTDGSQPPVKLSPPLGPTGHVYPGQFAFTPDGERIVLVFAYRLYSTLADGSQPAVALPPPLISPGAWKIAATGLVVYTTDELYSMPADGSAAPTVLSVGHPANLDVSSRFVLSPDGQRVAYRGQIFDALNNGDYWVFGVPADGSAFPVTLFGPVATEEESIPEPVLQISADSQWVVHRSDPLVFSQRVLESAPIDGSAPAQPIASGGSSLGSNFRISSDGRVLFAFAPDASTPVGLYVAPVDHSAAALRLTPSSSFPPPNKWEASPQGRVVFTTTGFPVELYSVPIDGSAPPVQLSPPMVAGGSIYSVGNDNVPSFVLDPEGKAVLYRADQQADEVWELFFVLVDGSKPARRVNKALPAGGDVSYLDQPFTPDGRRALYRGDQLVNDVSEVFSSALYGNSQIDPLNPLTPGMPIR